VSDRRLYLVRHARPDYDSTEHTETPLGRQYDPPLGETGRAQAELLADRLALMPRPAAVYSSTLARARETAHAYADRIGMPVIERDDLCEWFGGGWEAKDFEQIFAEHPEAIDLFRNQNPAWHLAPGSERADDFQGRCVAAVESIIEAHPVGDVVVVAHGGVISVYACVLLGCSFNSLWRLRVDNASLTVVKPPRRLVSLNDTAHLTGPLAPAPVTRAESASR
jgi:broad specificity phosphatase PhoE